MATGNPESYYRGRIYMLTRARVKEIFPLLLAVVLLFSLSSCSKTVLSDLILIDSKLESDINQLSSVNRRQIRVLVESNKDLITLGHQYLLLIFPFGRIVLPANSQLPRSSTKKVLALKGYRVIHCHDQSQNPDLIIRVKRLTLTAYDLLFFRRLVARVALEAKRRKIDGTYTSLIETTQSKSDFAKFGFSQQLTPLFRQTFEDTLNKLLPALNL